MPIWSRSPKRSPGKLTYGSAGTGTPGHLTGEMFKSAAGMNIQHVPYRGSAPAVTDLVGGQIQIMFDPLQSVLSNVQGGRLRAIALSSKARSSVLPNVPTIAESGYPDFETTAWWGVFAPARLPDDLAAALADEIASDRAQRCVPRQARAARRGADGPEPARISPNSSAASWPNGARRCASPARRWTERNETERRRAGHSRRQVTARSPQQALRHQIAVGDFFGAADFVPVTQAHIMADTESLGEAGVR